jgi:hypothetical protein
MATLREKLILKLEDIDGLKNQPSPVVGGSALFFNDKEFAHFHNDNELDLRLTKKVISSEGLSHPMDSLHHPKRSAGSPWIEVRFEKVSDLKNIVKLVKLAVDQL